MVGYHMFVLTHKLQILEIPFKLWNNSNFGDVSSNVKLVKAKLHNIQPLLHNFGDNDVLRSKELEAQSILSKALDIEDCFWKEKSIINWPLEGAYNTAFFHKITKIKNSFKPITVIKDGEDTLTV